MTSVERRRATQDRGVRAGSIGAMRVLRAMWSGSLAAAILLGCADDDGAIRLVGIVERTLIEVSAPVSETIVAVHVARGDPVKAGDALVHLDPILAEVEVTRADAALAAARSGVAVAGHDRQRALELRAGRATSEQALERAELAHEEAVAREREARAQLAAAQKRRNDVILTAPVDGVVDQLPFDLGERVPAGAVLAVLLADGAPWVRVWLPEASFVHVAPGTPAEVRIDGIEGPLRGRVLDVAREPEFTPHYALTERDRVHLVYETRVEIVDGPAELRPGVPADVMIGTASSGAPEEQPAP
ncbi:MAG: efflux RND transporter periplasmic adaptor subunit [Myxococcales bacterium]|nr:efflux RND transporter periplasmic adaptor subunit [Myxococcales bacterium]